MPPRNGREDEKSTVPLVAASETAEKKKKKELRDRVKREFSDIIHDDENANLVVDIILLPNGLTLGIGGFIAGGGVSTGIATQERFEKFIQARRSELSLSAVTVEKPRPDAGPPGVDWSISITT